MENLYEQLMEKLNTLGVGFPPEANGGDIAYLKKIFTEEHAQVFIAMEDRFQLPQEVAKSLNRSQDEIRTILDVMSDKGLVMITTKTDPKFYAPLAYLVGWGDWTGQYIDKEGAMLEGVYKSNIINLGILASKAGFDIGRDIFRTVPVYEAIPDKSAIAPYDDLRKIFENAGTISVAECYCDIHYRLRGEKIAQPTERCFLFGAYADYLIEKGFGRKVTVDEAMKIMEKSKEGGFVPNFADMEKPIFLCNCYDHCGGNSLREAVLSNPDLPHNRTNNFYATVNADSCTGCETCVDKCWFHAISMKDGIADINLSTCNGCGQCVINCPTNAMSLKQKPKSEHYKPIVSHPKMKSSEEYMAGLERYKDIIKTR
jgi:Na+-translocating ferredoxin:NAD+ oxidoreductase subunit B